MFEGPPDHMVESLAQLGAVPSTTPPAGRVQGAHRLRGSSDGQDAERELLGERRGSAGQRARGRSYARGVGGDLRRNDSGRGDVRSRPLRDVELAEV